MRETVERNSLALFKQYLASFSLLSVSRPYRVSCRSIRMASKVVIRDPLSRPVFTYFSRSYAIRQTWLFSMMPSLNKIARAAWNMVV